MTEKEKKWCFDILQAIKNISAFTVGIDSFDSYNSDLKTQSAVERQLSIIGEAVNQLRKSESTIKLSHTNEIVGFRNWIVHAYDTIDSTIVWTILQVHLPILEAEINDQTTV
ncbi:MAG: HepT-like ribonuclease domain-containing protein [Nonlabens sp.]